MSNIKDFVIENGILKKYKGKDTNVEVPDGVISICKDAFSFNKSIYKIVLPSSVLRIEKLAFSNCLKLNSITFSEKIEKIEDGLFYSCWSLHSVTIPHGVTSIGDYAFEGCNTLYEISIPDSVTNIGKSAFEGCRALKKITIPQWVTTIGSRAFWGCGQIESIRIPSGVTTINNGTFDGCSCLNSVTLTENISSIGDYAFEHCKKLSDIIIPKSVTSIGKKAFYNCSSFNSNIPSDVTSVGEKAFAGCRSLADSNGFVVINEKVYDYYCEEDKDLIVPDGITHIYDNDRDFTNHIRNLVIPESVIHIDDNFFKRISVSGTITTSFLKKSLANKKKMSVLMSILYNGEPKDTARILMYCSGKGWTDTVNSKFNKADVDIVLATITEELKKEKKIKKDAATRVIDYMINALPYASIEILLELCDVLKQKGADVSDLESSKRFNEKISKTTIGENATKEKLHPIELYVNENYEKHGNLRDIEKLVKDGVKYAGSDEKCSKEALVLLIGAFAENYQENKYYSLYKTCYATCEMSHVSDRIAEALDKTELSELLGKLAYEHGKAYFLPYGRYASEGQIAELLSWMRKWENWGVYSGKGRKNILDARAGVLLSDTKNAMMHFDKIEKLGEYASFHNTDAETIRDTVLADFGFDEDGKKTYNVGTSVIAASLQNDLTIVLFDETTGKPVKSVPKKNNDPDKVLEASEDLSDMKKTLKKFIKSRFEKLFSAFLEAAEFDSENWKTSYLNNAVLRKCAEILVWQQNNVTFIINDKKSIASDGTEYEIGVGPIKLAHPMEMKKEDVKAWQKYFISKNIKQPFIQIWEPVVNFESVSKERYNGIKMPIMRFANYSKHGIIANGYYAYSEEFDVKFKDCTLDITSCDCYRIVFDCMDGQDYTFGEFAVEKVSRYSNHIVALLDKWSVADKIKNDDFSIVNILSSFTLAQITELINIANESGSVNCMAVLLEHKNKYYSDYNPMEVFTLE